MMDIDNQRGNAYKEWGFYHARVAELVDALDLGSSPPERIGVQLPSLAPIFGSFAG
jgi:hypothetical protein